MGEPIQIDYNELDLKANLGAFSTFDAEALVPEILKLGVDDCYLEVGVDKGKSLSIVNMIAPKGVRLYGVDINKPEELTLLLNKNKHISFIQRDSVEVARTFLGEISVLFIDGDHSYKGCKRDIDAWLPHMKQGGVMLFHDCDESSPGVVQAVSEFVNNYHGVLKEFKLFKRTDKNTSMAMIRL